MERQEFLAKMDKWLERWRVLDKELVELVNTYQYSCESRGSPRDNFEELDNGDFGRRLDALAERRGWIEDRLNGRTWSNRKCTKKIRRALGYTYP